MSFRSASRWADSAQIHAHANQLLRNGRLMDQYAGTDSEPDFIPVVKLFKPDAGCTIG